MARGRKPIGDRALTDSERVARLRARRPRTETLHRAMAQVLRQGVRDGWISEHEARAALDAELEGLEVGPDRRRLTKSEREEIVSKVLKGDR